MQDLWKDKLDWDVPIPNTLLKRWLTFQSNLSDIENIRCPRWVNYHPEDNVEFHGFGDASQHAFAAAVYIRTCSADGSCNAQLLIAKTRVAPVKTVTIPKLELCAALLTTQVVNYVKGKLGLISACSHIWSDSINALTWIKHDNPSKWTVYVANRVSEIQRTSADVSWHYVPSKENPADLASRGITPRALAESKLWWQGPSWLSQSKKDWPKYPMSQLNLSRTTEESSSTHVLTYSINLNDSDLISRFSSLTRLTRVIAYCLRVKPRHHANICHTHRISQSLSADEIQKAYLACVLYSQHHDFAADIKILQEGKTLSCRSPLARLNPFVDQNGILRVGGRLANAPLPYDQRHPVILHGKSPLAQLVINWAHRTALHGGFLLTYSFVARRAWLIRGRVRIKAHIRACILCARNRAQKFEQLMGNLPLARISVSYPFERIGVDYAGPFAIKRISGRGSRTVKGYLALFVCLASKAVHLEAVGDLTTQSFLGALRRLIGRRGTPHEIWSDNATTFHGADAELRSMLREAEIDWKVVEDSLANQGIKWTFISPSAPHFGGLWEANIKSAKSHLKKIIGSRSLTYEEFSTLLVEVEACMNSRPILPITGDPDDVNALTPAHALIGRNLNQLPEATSSNKQINYATHWLLVKAMRDQVWKRWSREYVHTLQQRNKWTSRTRNLQIGDLVLILDPSLLRNGKWPLGRTIKVYTGSDGLVRSACIRTASGTYDRPIVKLCLLPLPT